MATSHGTPRRDLVLVPGAWSTSESWEPVTGRLRALGHRVRTITLSGLRGEADAERVGLATHVADVLALLEREDLRDVVLVGHSYSGIVVGQVADRAPDRVAHTVFVEAFLPHDGWSMLAAFGDEAAQAAELRSIEAHGGLWPAPSAEELAQQPGLTDEQRRWLAAHLVDHPGRVVSEPAVMARPASRLHATFIVGTMGSASDSDDVRTVRGEPTWAVHTIEAGHWPMLTAPERLARLIADVAAG